MKRILPLILVLGSLSSVSYADQYTSPSDAGNPPQTFEDNPASSNPDIYTPNQPAATQTPPTQTNTNPIPNTQPQPAPQQPAATMNNTSTNQTPPCPVPAQPEATQPSTTQQDATPESLGNGSGDDSDTMHDPDPEKEDVGTAPVQPS